MSCYIVHKLTSLRVFRLSVRSFGSGLADNGPYWLFHGT